MQSIRALWKNLALSLITLLVIVGVCELVVRSFVPVRNVGPSFTVYDSFYGKTLKKSFSTRRITPEFTMHFTTNSEGFRGPELGSLSLRPILFLGDSFTMGYGVNDGEEFPALVRKALNARSLDPVPVINAGMGDNGNGRWVKFLRDKAKQYNPALVVLQIQANDFLDNIRERLFELTPAGSLRERPVPSQAVKRTVQRLVDRIPGMAYSYLIGLVRQVSWGGTAPQWEYDSETPPVNQKPASPEEQLLFRLLEEVLTICEDEGWHILAVMVGIPDKRLAKMEKFFSDRSVLTVVIPTKRERPDLYYKVDGHWNASGHSFTAVRILEAIEEFHFRH